SRKEAVCDRAADRVGDLRGGCPRFVIEGNLKLCEPTARRAEVEPSRRDLCSTGEHFLGSEGIKQWLQRGATGDDLAGAAIGSPGFMVGNPHQPGAVLFDEIDGAAQSDTAVESNRVRH